MPAIITDYQGGYSRTGAALAGAAEKVGDVISNAMIRAPQEKREKEMYDIKMDEFNKSRDYRVKQIENVQSQTLNYMKENGIKLSPEDFEQFDKSFEDLKKAPADEVANQLKTVSSNLVGLHTAHNKVNQSGDAILPELVQKTLPFDFNGIWNEPNYGTAASQFVDKAIEKRKTGIVSGWIEEIQKSAGTDKNGNPIEVPRETVYGEIAKKQAADPFLKNQTLDIAKTVDNIFQKKSEIASQENAQKGLALEERRTVAAEKTAGINAMAKMDDVTTKAFTTIQKNMSDAEAKIISAAGVPIKNLLMNPELQKNLDKVTLGNLETYQNNKKAQEVLNAAVKQGQSMTYAKAFTIAKDLLDNDTSNDSAETKLYRGRLSAQPESGDTSGKTGRGTGYSN